ncbi:MAG: DUF4065 domain-containing protein [Polyangiaceae bacterium]
MATAAEVAAFIKAEASCALSRMKLLKLVYYAQAWALAWDGEPLFADRIEAWADGPVVRSLWAKERHGSEVPPNSSALSAHERDTVRAVLAFYAEFDGDRLSEFTHAERPWVDARDGVPLGTASNAEISVVAMQRYYGAIKCDGKTIPKAYREALEYTPDSKLRSWTRGADMLGFLLGLGSAPLRRRIAASAERPLVAFAGLESSGHVPSRRARL